MAHRRGSLSLALPHPGRGMRRALLAVAALAMLIIGFKLAGAITGHTNALDRTAVHLTAPLVRGEVRTTEGVASLGQVFHLPSVLHQNEQLRQEKVYLENELTA